MAPRQRNLSSPRPTQDDGAEAAALLAERKVDNRTIVQTEADIARDRHDYFNLVALLIIIGATGLNYSYEFSKLTLVKLTWTGAHFWLNWGATMVYFLVDLLWVLFVPICVKSPGVIIKHHFVAMLIMVAPPCYPEYRWFMGSLLSVEINTWLLIVRRVVYKASGEPVWPLLGYIVSVMFYLTWIVIRCIIYPITMVTFLHLAVEKVETTGNYFHLAMLFIPIHGVLCAFNFKWTYDLFKPIVKRWLGIGDKPVGIQSGL